MTLTMPISTPVRIVMYFLIAVTFIFLLRSLWTYPIEHNDAMQKYFYAAEILRMGDWSILLTNHHTLRWAAMLPQTGLTWLLGTRYEVFFILPLLVFSAYLVLIVFSMRNILNFSQQLLLWSLLFFEPFSLLTSNQFLITGLGIFCAYAGVVTLVYQGKHHRFGIVLAAVFFFTAYGAHVTYLSFAAGGFLWLMLFQKNITKALIFIVTILILILLETLVYNQLSDGQLTWGRLEVLASGEHIGRSLNYSPAAFSQLFTRWLTLPVPLLLLCLGFIAAGIWLVGQKKNNKPVPQLIECSYMVGLSFAVVVTFAIISIDPLRPMMPLRPRYLMPFFPFAAIMTVYMLSIVAARVPSLKDTRKEFAAILVFTLFLLIIPTYKIDFFHSKFDAFMWKAEREYSEFSQKFERGELLLTGDRRIAYSMIARFKKPVSIHFGESELSAINLSETHLCVQQLNKSPLNLNYEDCAD